MPPTKISSAELEERLLAVLRSLGQDATPAARLAVSALIEAERLALPEFGISLLARAVRQGSVAWGSPLPQSRTGVITTIEAAGAFAPLALAEAAQLAARDAHRDGIGVVVVVDPGGLGRLAPYVRHIADLGLVGFTTVGSHPLVAPHGGNAPALGTNPIAAALPSHSSPIVVDTSSSALTKGRWSELRERGEQIPAGSAIDAAGAVTLDAETVSAFLPRGGVFGTVIAIVVEALTNGVAGIVGSSGRAALVVAIRGLDREAATAEVGDDLRRRLEESGGHVPGQVGSAPASISVSLDLLREIERLAT